MKEGHCQALTESQIETPSFYLSPVSCFTSLITPLPLSYQVNQDKSQVQQVLQKTSGDP